ncbi:FAD-dependent monooxygenase [Plantactinospora sp. B6F1]|uniref:FAD-dependent monooxygenase n=1 Tax=Plantactinospora sp. B6F1 TaxID=3158971 RepID=UPI0032D8B952
MRGGNDSVVDVGNDDLGHVGSDIDVLVVGAGPTGLALAAQLRAFGARVRIIDRQVDRVHESRALAIQPRTLEVLDGLGVTPELIRRGNQTVRLQMHFNDRILPVPLFDIGTTDTAYPYLLFLSQAETERVLGEHLDAAGIPVQRGAALTALDEAEDTVVCTVRHADRQDEQVRASYVVGCDGAHSTVRRLADIAFRGAVYPQTFVLADLEVDGIEPGAAHVFVSPRGMLFFFPLAAPASWRMLAMRPRTDSSPPDQQVTLDQVQALSDTYTAGRLRLYDPLWMTNFRLHNRGAARYRSGRLFLAGDAAHIHSPAGAQGMNTGIQDAVNLGWKLAFVVRGVATPGLLDTYETERAPVGRAVLRFTDRAFTVATSTNPILRQLRARLVPRIAPLALRIKPARAYGFRAISQLAIHYRRSAASTDQPGAPRRGPRAGDRLPDAPVTGNTRANTLHRALATPTFHLLLCGPDPWPMTGVTDLINRYRGLVTTHFLTHDNSDPAALHDHTGQALRNLGLDNGDNAQYLVRPDGHIAYRSSGTDLTRLHRYLAQWLGTQSPTP